jgi:ADP-heptose:LPS heptosyltransferase
MSRANDDIGRVRDESIERVVMIFPGALGDFLLALPALRAMRARHAAAGATVVVKESLRELALLAAVADVAVAIESAESAALFGSSAMPAWLAGRPVVYSWLGGSDAEVRARLAATTRAVRFFAVERGAGTEHAAVAYARAADVRGSLAALGVITPPASAAADALSAELSAPVLAIHAGAGSRAKRWDIAGFVQVAHWWRASGGTVIALGGPAEAGEAPALGAREVREWPLCDLAALLARVALYLGNDSGVSHLAGAVGAPGVVLFGPTDARRWRPLGDRLAVLRARSVAPDGITLTALPPTRVIAACRRRFTLTRGDLDTSVRPEGAAGAPSNKSPCVPSKLR